MLAQIFADRLRIIGRLDCAEHRLDFLDTHHSPAELILNLLGPRFKACFFLIDLGRELPPPFDVMFLSCVEGILETPEPLSVGVEFVADGRRPDARTKKVSKAHVRRTIGKGAHCAEEDHR
jgi:hypothetical protein